MSTERRRSSLGLAKNKIKVMQPMLATFTSKEFLTAHSLFNNLYSSEDLKIDLSTNDFMKTVFGKKHIMGEELYEFSYFHKREKKLILYHFLLHFLTHTAKIEIVLFLNSESIDREELKDFLIAETNGGKQQLWDEFTKRVLIFYNRDQNTFLFNLQYLALLMKTHEFLKAVAICDINTFESNQRNALDKYYKRIPRELAAVVFRKDFYEYKLMQKTTFSYVSEQGDQETMQLHEKVAHYLRKKSQLFSHQIALVAPLEYLNDSAKTIEETYRTVLLRANPLNERIQEIVYHNLPFKIESVRDI